MGYENVKLKTLDPENYSLIIGMPYAVKSGLIYEIFPRFLKKNFGIFYQKHLQGDASFWDSFYPSDLEWLYSIGARVLTSNEKAKINTKEKIGTDDPVEVGRIVKGWRCRDMSGISLSAIIIGDNAAAEVREMCGATIPIDALPGTIRHDFSNDDNPSAFLRGESLKNVLHCSNPREKRDKIRATEFEIRLAYPEFCV